MQSLNCFWIVILISTPRDKCDGQEKNQWDPMQLQSAKFSETPYPIATGTNRQTLQTTFILGPKLPMLSRILPPLTGIRSRTSFRVTPAPRTSFSESLCSLFFLLVVVVLGTSPGKQASAILRRVVLRVNGRRTAGSTFCLRTVFLPLTIARSRSCSRWWRVFTSFLPYFHFFSFYFSTIMTRVVLVSPSRIASRCCSTSSSTTIMSTARNYNVIDLMWFVVKYQKMPQSNEPERDAHCG